MVEEIIEFGKDVKDVVVEDAKAVGRGIARAIEAISGEGDTSMPCPSCVYHPRPMTQAASGTKTNSQPASNNWVNWKKNVDASKSVNKKPSLRDHKDALKDVHKEVGKLPKGKEGKFGSPQRGDSKKGYRLDPPHNREPGHPESKPHINWWDYSQGKRGKGGRSGAVTIPPERKN